MAKQKALIVGISGQDGAYLTQLLLQNGYEVHGTSRDAGVSGFSGLKRLGLLEKVKLHSMAINDFRSVMQVILEVQPDEVYNLAGQTSVGLSFQQPVETLESISVGTLNILEVIRFHKLPVKFYNACSSECFGETGGQPANEDTPFRPRSPYAVAKATSFWQIANYREAYNIFACSGILFNHESPLRPNRFVTKKIIQGACRISQGKEKTLSLGSLNVSRDWGWAPEFVVAMHAMLQQQSADDYVIATGRAISLERFVELAFAYFKLDYRDFVKSDASLHRPTDILFSQGDASKARTILHWQATVFVERVVENMIADHLSTGL